MALQTSSTRTLVIVAHGDDEVLGCGGTIARLRDEGSPVKVVICTSRGERLDEESRLAAARLGHTLSILPNPNDLNIYGTVGVSNLADVLLISIREFRPDLIITHSRADVNQDHRAIHDAVLVAARPVTTSAQLWAFRGEGADWGCGSFGQFTPTIFVDIGTSMHRKAAALACYRSQSKMPPHPRSCEAVSRQARHWGAIANLYVAEPFQLLRAIL